jgi:hypothetical protein
LAGVQDQAICQIAVVFKACLSAHPLARQNELSLRGIGGCGFLPVVY